MVDDGFEAPARPALAAAALRAALAGPGRPWRDVQVVAATGSTNADLVVQARDGAAAGLVLVAEEQTAGRGRLGRSWTSPARSGLTFSVLLRPVGPPARLGWLPLLTGLAVAESVSRLAGLDVRLKWPNDLLVGERKLGGILAERVGTAVVVGLGLNVTAVGQELPGPWATSLAAESAACIDRDPILVAVLRRLAERVAAWDRASADPELRLAYTQRCASLGRTVRAELPGGRVVAGIARSLDPQGRLVVETDCGPEPLSAGDLVHLR